MKRYIKKVLDDVIDLLMGANFLVDSYREIIYDIISNPDININTDKFDQYIKEYSDKYIYYELLKRKVSNQYISNEIYRQYDVSWDINFSSKYITITIDQDIKDDTFILDEGWKRI